MQSRGELKGRVWRYLNKTSALPGFYDDAKMNDTVDEALTYIAVTMFLAGEGWLTKYLYFDTVGGQVSLDLPGNVAMIRDCRYKVSDVWYSIPYDDQDGGFSYIGTGVQQAFAYRYRLLGKQIVFDPPLSMGGDRFLQLEVVYYPDQLVNDLQMIDPQFDNACREFMKYKMCSILGGSMEKESIPWAKEEAQWEQLMLSVVTRRNLRSTTIREYLG